MKNTFSRKSKVNKKLSTSSLCLALESRLLFDGAIMATVNDTIQDSAAQKDSTESDSTVNQPDVNFETL